MDVFNSAQTIVGPVKENCKRKQRVDKGKTRVPPKKPRLEKPKRERKQKDPKENTPKSKKPTILLVPEKPDVQVSLLHKKVDDVNQIDMDSLEFWRMVNEWVNEKERLKSN